MSATDRRAAYVQVPHRLSREPRWTPVFSDRGTLGAWLQMYLAADAAYPNPAPVPRLPNGIVDRIHAAGFIEIVPGNRYTWAGLAETRTAASDQAREAARARWGNAHSNAEGMPGGCSGDAHSNAEGMPTETETETDLLPTVGETIPAAPVPTTSTASPPGSAHGPLDDVIELRRVRGGWSQPNREAEIKAEQSASRQAAKKAPRKVAT